MVIDTSAVVAVLKKESGFENYLRAITEAEEAYMSAINLLECHLVLAVTPNHVSRFMEESRIVVRAFTMATVSLATQAFLQYGKGRHRAALNICDCAAYATAKECNMPLLYRGSDFIHTDITAAL